MKKIFVMLLALILLLLVVGCSKEAPAEPHVHSYTSQVTTAPKCLSGGVKTFTCTCGHSYMENMRPLGHQWSAWEPEVLAVVGRIGTETRQCVNCSQTESRETFDNSIDNSFLDYQLQWFMYGDDAGKITAGNLLNYAAQKYPNREEATINLTSTTVFNYLARSFTLTDAMKEAMKQDARYNASNDTFTLKYQMEFAGVTLLGYKQNDGDNYSVYYRLNFIGSDITAMWRVDMVFNLANNLPNKYLSFTKVSKLPSDIVIPDQE